ncbi:MAG: hypothetical protein P8M07_06220, partial [Flavobacteriales bacterium]|nr:hypothetical protein [Flavobacteriales bacterium]
EAIQLITIRDTTAPSFTSLETFATTTCEEGGVIFAEATDTCSNVFISMATYSAIGVSPEGQQLRIYIASDDCGNTVEGIQLVQFLDAENCLGCTSEGASNYSATASIDDGSCIMNSLYDENGTCISDTDEDGVCDLLEIVGCQDEMACNYMVQATDAGDCLYPSNADLDCSGNCLDDADEDGVCDNDEVEGCQDMDACDYNPNATESSSCSYSCLGCTYSEASNYDSSAYIEDGSCQFPSSCEGDLDLDGAIGVSDLLMLLDGFATMCE